MKPLTGLVLIILLLQNRVFAQEKIPDHSNEKCSVRFGKMTPADFNLSAYKYDSGASAVVIADVGESHMEGNSKGWFSIVYKRSRRVKILNKNGYDAAQEEISLYTGGNSTEKIEGLKATTYNLENGKVVETRLDDKSVFTDKVNKNRIRMKFGFPAVKEGSVIEYSYTIQSDFIYNFRPWVFQGQYPCLWSEYTVTIPEYFQYIQISQGLQFFYIRKPIDRSFNAKVIIPGGAERDRTFALDGRATEYRMVMKDVPPLKKEAYTTTLSNYIAKIEFQLSSYAFPQMPPKNIMGNWNLLSEKLMEAPYFGAAITKNNGWMDDEVKEITKGTISEIGKAQKIYAYIRDNFNCTGNNGFEVETPLKTVFKDKSGTSAELNLLLTAMLAHVNLNADPVILGTRESGFTNPFYPLITRFNYVVCRVNIDTATYYLDASQSWMGFGHLPGYCYNGHARVVSRLKPEAVFFYADSLKEQKTTMVLILSDDKGQMSGTFQSILGYIASSDLRKDIHKRGEKEYFKDIQASYPPEFAISNTGIDSLKIQEEPVKVSYEFTYKPAAEDGIIYFNPMLGEEGYRVNPFKSAERNYPVEMPYARDEIYLLTMAVPNGYVVDEMPKSVKVLFNDDEGFFEYLVVSDGQNIQLSSHLKLTRANFQPEDYATLRDFYAFIVKKQGEQIVFKRKK